MRFIQTQKESTFVRAFLIQTLTDLDAKRAQEAEAAAWTHDDNSIA